MGERQGYNLEFSIGTRLYHLREKLGGDCSETWVAKERGAEKPALAVVKRPILDHPDPRVRRYSPQYIRNEIAALEYLLDAGLECAPRAFASDDSVPVFARAYIPGLDLSQVVSMAGPLSLAQGAWLLLALGSPIDELHGHGIVHRDIKPSNIIVPYQTSGGTHPILNDFGLAQVHGESCLELGPHAVVGSPNFSAPESVEQRIYSPRSDIFSLGATLYWALTGRPHVTGDTPVEIMSAQVRSDFTPLHEIASVPPLVSSAVMRALTKDPSQRPATVRAFASEYLRAIALSHSANAA